MSKKNKKKAATRSPKGKNDTKKEDKLDFGGIPARDLKKNLGCG